MDTSAVLCRANLLLRQIHVEKTETLPLRTSCNYSYSCYRNDTFFRDSNLKLGLWALFSHHGLCTWLVTWSGTVNSGVELTRETGNGYKGSVAGLPLKHGTVLLLLLIFRRHSSVTINTIKSYQLLFLTPICRHMEEQTLCHSISREPRLLWLYFFPPIIFHNLCMNKCQSSLMLLWAQRHMNLQMEKVNAVVC